MKSLAKDLSEFAEGCDNLRELLNKAQQAKMLLRVSPCQDYTSDVRIDAVREDYMLVSHEIGDGGITGPVSRNHFVLPFGSSSFYHFW